MRIAFRYAQGLAGLRAGDILLASFPKSGSTWIRFFLRNLISISEEAGELVTFPLLDATMPELGASNLLLPWPYRTIPRFVKTHKPYVAVMRGRRKILVTRDPRDVMVSYYSYVTGKVRSRFDGTFPEFVRHETFGLKAWFEHYRAWKRTGAEVVRYEDLRTNDVETFARMLAGVGVHLSTELIEAAAERARLERVRGIEDQYGHTGGAVFREGRRFAGAGESGGWRRKFPTDLLGDYWALRTAYEVAEYGDGRPP